MRLPAEQIKEAILHQDQSVREAAILYLADTESRNPAIMTQAIEAFQRFGLDTFGTFSFLIELQQSSESIVWLVDEIERVGESTDEQEREFASSLQRVLRQSDPELLKQHFETICSMQHLDELSHRVIADRITVDCLMADELWAELDNFCQDHDDDTLEDEDWEHGRAIVAALARDRVRACQQVTHILDDPGEYTGWHEVLIARLTGELQLESAVSMLADRLDDPDSWACQEAQRALHKIGTDAVVREFARRFADGDWDMRVIVAGGLERIRTDFSVETCLDLLKKEDDEFIRGILLEAVLMNFCHDGIEPARQHVLRSAKSPEMLEVRTALLVACKLLGETFPEFEAWQEDAKHDVEFRRQWYKDHPFKPLADLGEFDEDDFDEDTFAETDLEEQESDESPPTTLRRGQRIARNDPCPCGSGKKFKKCCYGKVDSGEETDTDHAAALSRVRPEKSAQKYPIGTIALYGPDDSTTTKIVAAVVKRERTEPILERWVGTAIGNNPKVRRQIREFFDRHHVNSVVATEGNLGCPHEEGLDFPSGEDCPFCPFWAGKQGSAQRD
jgi:HEAT repeat protein